MKTMSIAGGSLALILTLSACGSTSGSVDDSAPPATPSVETPAAEAPQAAPDTVSEPAPEPEPEDDGPAKFGETFTYEDGIAISVSQPVTGQASEYAAGGDETGGAIRILTVTILNGTKKVFDPGMVRADLNYGPNGTAASRVFDSSNNLGAGFEGKILPGKKQVAKLAFGVPKGPQEILVSISPSFKHNEVLFHGDAVK